MKDQYVDIPPDLMGKADPDQQWIEQQLDRIDPWRHEQGHDGADMAALRKLVLELRNSLRDEFAGKAMQAALMTVQPGPQHGMADIIEQAAKVAYESADAMLKARVA